MKPGYLDWKGLATYSSCSKRWLQGNVPRSLRIKVGGKVLVRTSDFDTWMERHRQGHDIDRLVSELLDQSTHR